MGSSTQPRPLAALRDVRARGFGRANTLYDGSELDALKADLRFARCRAIHVAAGPHAPQGLSRPGKNKDLFRSIYRLMDNPIDSSTELDAKQVDGEPQVDMKRLENAVREILIAVGEDPEREGLRETPARVARMYAELFSGLRQDPRVHLRKFFTEKYDEVVLVRDISFCSLCEHHLLPFTGHAHIGYIPNGRVVGLSKLARVVEVVARRPQVQERMTEQIAQLLVDELDVRGVAVVIEATHSCMTIRGVKKPGSLCVTSAMKGIFRSHLSSRSEVMQLIYGNSKG